MSETTRKIFLFNFVTLDGFFKGPNEDIGWHNFDGELGAFSVEQLDTLDLLLFGRVTYQGMADYWSSPAGIADDAAVANRMNSLSKIVFSRTLRAAEWNNTRLIADNIAEELNRIKRQPGKDIGIFGSGKLAASLTKLGLIDEYRLVVNPVILGRGTPLFEPSDTPLNLTLASTRVFGNGNVMLCYRPAPAKEA